MNTPEIELKMMSLIGDVSEDVHSIVWQKPEHDKLIQEIWFQSLHRIIMHRSNTFPFDE